MGRSISGVTLMELMVTMAILAVIAGIAIPSYKAYMHSSYLTECQNEVAAIQLAEQEYFLENNVYFPNPVGAKTGIQNIEGASGGLYVSGYTVQGNAAQTNKNLAKANCAYKLTSNAGPGYKIEVTGQNNLDAASDSFTVTK
jgi:type IV pilus assembly protein PilE